MSADEFYRKCLSDSKDDILNIMEKPEELAKRLVERKLIKDETLSFVLVNPMRWVQNERLFTSILRMSTFSDIDILLRGVQQAKHVGLEKIIASIRWMVLSKYPEAKLSIKDAFKDEKSDTVQVSEQTPEPKAKTIHDLVEVGSATALQIFFDDLNKSAVAGSPDYWVKSKDDSTTPFHKAAALANSIKAREVLECLVKNYHVPTGRTSPDSAAGSLTVPLETLLDHQDPNGDTAVHIAARSGNEDIVSWFISKCVNCNLKNEKSETAVSLMARRTPGAFLKLLDRTLRSSSGLFWDGGQTKIQRVDFTPILNFPAPSTTKKIKTGESGKVLPTAETTAATAADPTPSKASQITQDLRVSDTETAGGDTVVEMKDLELKRREEIDIESTRLPLIPSTDQKCTVKDGESLNSKTEKSVDAGQLENEMKFLAQLVLVHAGDATDSILNHVLVRLFLEQKWDQRKSWMRFFSLLYILLHLLYILFIIHVFIVSVPQAKPNEDFLGHSQQSFFDYFLGQWRPVRSNISHNTPNNDNNHHGDEYLHSSVTIAAAIFLLISSVVFLGIEIAELIFTFQVTQHSKLYSNARRDQKKSDGLNKLGKVFLGSVLVWFSYSVTNGCFYSPFFVTTLFFWTVFLLDWVRSFFCTGDAGDDNEARVYFQGILSYVNNLENGLQLIFIALTSHMAAAVIAKSQFVEYHYVMASVSVLPAGILILLQIGHTFSQGKYVQMLKTTLQSLLALTPIYLPILLTYGVSFSILFSEENLFPTLPESFFRMLAMVGGELNFDDIFNPTPSTKNETDPEIPLVSSSSTSLPFSLARHLVHGSFVVLVTILLVNLLIGVIVDDVQKMREKSEVIRRSIQIERLYIVENFFCLWQTAVSQLCSRSGHNTNQAKQAQATTATFVVEEVEVKSIELEDDIREFWKKGKTDQ